MAQIISATHQASILGIPRANFSLARGLGATAQISASLEGYVPPRADLRLARGLRAPSGGSPPRSRATCPLGWISASLEGYAPPPSSESPPRSGVTRVRNPRTHSPDQSIKCSDTPRAPGSMPPALVDTAWESNPGVVPPTLPVRPSLAL
jgi:hypothetical protein